MARTKVAKVLNAQEFKRVESIVMTTRHKNRNLAILHFSFQLGLRACEIRQLTLGDILENDLMTIKEEAQLIKTKADKPRPLYLSNKKLRSIIQDHLKSMREYCEKKRILFSENRPLFMSQKGSFFHHVQIVMLFKKFFTDAGIEDARSHSGRRTFITNKIDEGCNIKYISNIVGHSNISTTVMYHDCNPNTLKEICSKNIF